MVVSLFCGVLWVCFMVAVGLLVVAVLCWRWIVFFFFSCSAIGVCGCGWWANGGGGESSCGWWADGGVGVCGSIGVGFGSVGGSVGFFFLVLTVDYGFLVVVVLGVCSAAVVVIVVVEQK